MSQIYDMTKLYFLGSMRRQVHLATLFLGVLLFMLPAYINAFSLGINAFERVSKDFGLTMINYFGVGMAILLASSAIPKDIENRSLYPILARPVNRSGYILAHFLAVALLLAMSFTFLGLSLSVAISAMTRDLELAIFLPLFCSYILSCVIAAFCIAVSTVASPALAGTAGAFVFLVGSLPGAFIRFFLVEDRDSTFAVALATGFKSILPNLSVFALKDPIVHEIAFNPLYVPAVIAYGLQWIAIFLLFATILFGRRDLPRNIAPRLSCFGRRNCGCGSLRTRYGTGHHPGSGRCGFLPSHPRRRHSDRRLQSRQALRIYGRRF